LFDNLYGDVRLIVVDDIEDVEMFIEEWADNISTVAMNIDDDPGSLDVLEENMIVRICNVGDMQFPDFFEQYDSVDDFNIYVDEEMEDPFEDIF
jgi:hypothetical protein